MTREYIPAFPFDTDTACSPGMSLRDYFAGEVLKGYASNPSGWDISLGEVARTAYSLADDMMKEREK